MPMLCCCCITGTMILSGGSDGLIAVSSPTTGMTVRVISDHKGAPITNIDVTNKQVRNAHSDSIKYWQLATVLSKIPWVLRKSVDYLEKNSHCGKLNEMNDSIIQFSYDNSES